MDNNLFGIDDIRFEISFKSLDELNDILTFYKRNKLYKLNIPCKGKLKKEFLLNSIKFSRDKFPEIDIIPHFSIQHEFRKTKSNTLFSLIEFLRTVNYLGCEKVLLVSGSQKRVTLDSISALKHIKNNILISYNEFSLGIAFNPYLPEIQFQEELLRLRCKLKSSFVASIWLQFGTDYELLDNRIRLLKDIINSIRMKNKNNKTIEIFGSILIPSKQLLSSFRFRPWKGVYCSRLFLDSLFYANSIISNTLLIYKKNNISPLIETNTSNIKNLRSLNYFLKK